MPLADEAILSTFEATILDPEILQRACARALAGDVHSLQTDAQRADLLKRHATILDELQRLTDALAAGGDSRSLRGGITTREAEAARLDRELAAAVSRAARRRSRSCWRRCCPIGGRPCGSTRPTRGR